MWWHADLPAALSSDPASEASLEPQAQGELLLEWILPTLGEGGRARRLWQDESDGGKRRALRRDLRDDDR